MDNVYVMKVLETLRNLVQVAPDCGFGDKVPLLGAEFYELEEVSALRKICDDTEFFCGLVEKRFSKGFLFKTYK